MQFSLNRRLRFSKTKKDGAEAGLAGGGSRIRTGDILLAKQTLYQLSYTPLGDMVGLTRVELVTSSLSGTRSNQLSYKPVAFAGGGSRIRTGDILLAKQTLYQLSYTPMSNEQVTVDSE